jgi:hypothetical protein
MMERMEKEDRPTGPTPVVRPLTCEEFQAQMPELMSGNIREHEHLETCDRCNALIDELEEIGMAARQLLNPDYEPPTLSWDKIRARIGEENSPSSEHSTV